MGCFTFQIIISNHKTILFITCPVLSRGMGQDGTVKIRSVRRPVSRPLLRLSPRPGFWQAVSAHPVPWQDFELVPLSLCPGTKKNCLSRRCPVPLETLVSIQKITLLTEIGSEHNNIICSRIFSFQCWHCLLLRRKKNSSNWKHVYALTDDLREKEIWRPTHFSQYQVFLCIFH